jgi:signal transduction histidine kinase
MAARRKALVGTGAKQRSADAATLVTYLQEEVERERAGIARELHDELGGMLVAAKMDLAAVERRVSPDDSTLRLQLVRLTATLDAALAFERRLVERLRPSMLDHLGLYAALRWQLKETCEQAGLQHREQLPAEELRLAPEAAITLFRIQQAALINIIERGSAQSVEFRVDVSESILEMRTTDDGARLPPDAPQSPGAHRVRLMRHRTEALGGTFSLQTGSGGVVVRVRVPLARLLAGP